MPSSLLSLALGLVCLTGQALSRPSGCPSNPAKVGKAIYFLTNELDCNSVAAIPIGQDGTLSGGTVTPTGGKGSNSVDAEGAPASPDPLVSQGALTVSGNFLFAVNAGSDSISMFSISKADPTKLTLIGQPVPVPGEFPTTIAASAKNGLVCVGTTGSLAGISCGSFNKHTGIGEMDALRPFEINQATPPSGPANTVSHTFFSQDESVLFTTVKGNPAANITGFVSSFSVEVEGLSREDVRSTPNGSAVLFGSQVIPGTNNIFSTDASLGALVLAVDDTSSQISTLAEGPVDGQGATCWATISPVTKTAFVTDVLMKRLVEMSVEDASILGELDLTETPSSGFIDLTSAGGYVYILAALDQPQVLVIDVSAGRGQASLSQAFDIAQLGVSANAQGMAVFK